MRRFGDHGRGGALRRRRAGPHSGTAPAVLAAVRVLAGLVPLDLRRLARDDLLSWLAGVPLVLVAAVRLGARPLAEALGTRGIDLEARYPLLAAVVFAVVLPVLSGTVIGFMLLADKEDGMWAVVGVTPVSLRGYLAWRAALAMALAAPATALGLAMGGLDETDWGPAICLALASAPLAAATALGLAAFAESTIGGVAGVKLGFVVLIIPALALARPQWWTAVAALVPSWWPLKTHTVLADGGPWPLWAVGCAAYGLALTGLCLGRAARSPGA